MAFDKPTHSSGQQELAQRQAFALKDADMSLALAKLKPVSGTFNRVTDFSSWIYRIKGISFRPMALLSGKHGEKTVKQQKERKRVTTALTPQSDWRPIYVDPLDDEEKPNAFQISSLQVRGGPLFGAPDYVFKNDITNTIMIVEVKTSNAEVPEGGWLNLRAQLWAYGHIDEFAQTRNVRLAGEVWNASGTSLRKTFVWDSADPRFNEENLQLFEKYRRWADLVHQDLR